MMSLFECRLRARASGQAMYLLKNVGAFSIMGVSQQACVPCLRCTAGGLGAATRGGRACLGPDTGGSPCDQPAQDHRR